MILRHHPPSTRDVTRCGSLVRLESRLPQALRVAVTDCVEGKASYGLYRITMFAPNCTIAEQGYVDWLPLLNVAGVEYRPTQQIGKMWIGLCCCGCTERDDHHTSLSFTPYIRYGIALHLPRTFKHGGCVCRWCGKSQKAISDWPARFEPLTKRMLDCADDQFRL